MVQTAACFAQLAAFRCVWLVTFAFARSPGDRPTPVCCAAHELKTGRTVCQWLDGELTSCPYDLGKDALLVAFDAADALGCHLAAGWPLPQAILDLHIEFKRKMNGRLTDCPESLAGALMAHGLDAADAPCPRHVRLLVQARESQSSWQRAARGYCNASTWALRRLLLAMLPTLDLPRALFRGRYAAALARVEYAGVPVDVGSLQALQDNWLTIRERLIEQVDQDFGVWRGGRFKEHLWLRWAQARGIPWPRHRNGQLQLGETTFRRMAALYPDVERVRALKSLLDQLRDFELPVGADGRARCASRPFATITGRNAPRGNECIFLWPAWCRGLVQAPPGRGLAYLDFEQQEYLIAGALSGDDRLLADYRAGDCYLSLGKSLGLIPPSGTAETHPEERRLCKTVALAVNYGMRPAGLAKRIGRPITVATDLLRRHAERYPAFWRWSDATVDFARCHGWLRTKYGWTYHVPRKARETTLRNWRVQATGAEVLRAAVCALDHAGIAIDATIHDAVLIEADATEIDDAVVVAERLMTHASAAVLGEPLRVEWTILRPGDRLLAAGKPTRTWERIWSLLSEEEWGGRQAAEGA
jgi:DNA polymerase I